MIKKILLNPWTALLTLALILFVRIADPSFIESVRLRYFDTLVTSQPTKDVPVYTVNIDEATLDKLGQFPFPRDMYADIIKDLYKRDAGLVVFNVLMPEKDRFGKDAVLGNTLSKYPVVLPALGSEKPKNVNHSSSAQVVGMDPSGVVVEYPGLINNVEPLGSLAAGVGVVNTFPEIDGVVRRMPMVIYSQEQLHPALALEALRVAAKDSRFQIKISDMGVEAVRVPKFGKIPTDDVGRVWIDWSASPREFSYTQLPESFDGGIVVVGLSAAGLANPVATARGEVWPHYLQGAALGTMVTQSNIQRPGWADQAEIIALLAAGVLVLFLSRWTYAFIPVVVVLGGSHYIASYLYSEYRYLVDITAFVGFTALVYIHAYSVKFVSEFLQKQQIRKQFSSYLSPDLVAKLVKDPSLLKLGGEEMELSIMFTDVRGFTSISEHYGKNVQGLTKIMNRYMTAMTRKILENDGTLDKYIGDAQMAFWNAPLDNRKHCKDAVKAALEMLGSLDGFNQEISEEGTPPFGMGIGINTGIVVVGNMGSEQRFDYTCLGDAVNLASRLEGQSKNYGVLIVLGPVTAERVSDEYQTLELDCIAVKGKKEGVNIYTVLGRIDELNVGANDLQMHNAMLALYRQQKFDQAIKFCHDLKGRFNGVMDHYYELWIERCNEMKSSSLPADWDGVFRATSK